MWECYAGKENQHDPYLSILEAEDFSSFPECYIETAEFDCLRDEGIQLAEVLEKNHVPVEVFHTTGTIHGFDVEEKSEYVRACVNRRLDFLRKGR